MGWLTTIIGGVVGAVLGGPAGAAVGAGVGKWKCSDCNGKGYVDASEEFFRPPKPWRDGDRGDWLRTSTRKTCSKCKGSGKS